MKTIYWIVLIFLPTMSLSQVNIDSVGHVNYFSLQGSALNDIWGYVDEDNNEYALVGGTIGTGVVDVTDPANPNEVFWEPGLESIWRDIKTFGDYAYVTTEAFDGLLIIDLSPLPASNVLPTNYYYGDSLGWLYTAHNIYIDSLGYAYIFGSNQGNGGVVILDIATDPMNPVQAGAFDNWYAHDGYALGDRLYVAHSDDGFFSILDITDRTNPVLLGTKNTPSSVTHNIWTTQDAQYAFTTDEVSHAPIASYDISDPSNILEVDRIQSNPVVGTVPHNAHVLGDYLVTSHYTDGIIVHDITYPYNMIEVGEFDTYPGENQFLIGCWGAYPYLPSGLILATDMQEGLFLLEPTYTKAAYLEGIISDASNSNPVDQVEVTLQGLNLPDYSNAVGFYATGILGTGTYDVTYAKNGYYSQTITVDLVNGVVTNQDVSLVPIPSFDITVKVRESGTNVPIIGADIRLESSFTLDEEQSNGLGDRQFTMYTQEVYTIIVGKWGYATDCFDVMIDQNTSEITVLLDPGFYDDFTFDFGWSTSSSASTGHWERGEPNAATSGIAVPGADVDMDCGSTAYVTGNAFGVNVNDDDVDGGEVTLISPLMDLSSYARWFFNQFGQSPADDSLRVTVSNGTSVAQVDIVGKNILEHGSWQYVNLRLQDYITITPTMQFFFKTSDPDSTENISEAGVDLFFISEYTVGLDELSKAEIQAFPNPTNGTVLLTNIESQQEYKVLNMNGQIILEGTVEPNSTEILLDSVESGVYFIHVSNQIVKIFKTK